MLGFFFFKMDYKSVREYISDHIAIFLSYFPLLKLYSANLTSVSLSREKEVDSELLSSSWFSKLKNN